MWGLDLPASILTELDERKSASISKEKDSNHNKKKRKVSFLSLLASPPCILFTFFFVKGEVIVYFLESNALRSLAVISTPNNSKCVTRMLLMSRSQPFLYKNNRTSHSCPSQISILTLRGKEIMTRSRTSVLLQFVPPPHPHPLPLI